MLELLGFAAGLVLLVAGADRAVAAAADLARALGVSPFFVGVTIVSVGTSVPELVTSVTATAYGAGQLAVGNIVGSEVAQITVAIGVVALVAPIVTPRRSVLVYGTTMFTSMAVLTLALGGGVVTWTDGVLMLLTYAAFVYVLYTNEGGEEVGEELTEPVPFRRAFPWIVVGLAGTVLGGQLVVTSAIDLARMGGVSEYLLGLVVGFGTTVPEIAVGVLAARRGVGGISIGTVLGSNITDPVFPLGVAALVAPVSVGVVPPASLWYMFVVSGVVLGVVYWRRGLRGWAAVGCLLLYGPSLLLG